MGRAIYVGLIAVVAVMVIREVALPPRAVETQLDLQEITEVLLLAREDRPDISMQVVLHQAYSPLPKDMEDSSLPDPKPVRWSADLESPLASLGWTIPKSGWVMSIYCPTVVGDRAIARVDIAHPSGGVISVVELVRAESGWAVGESLYLCIGCAL